MPKTVDHDKYRSELFMKCFDLFAEKGYTELTMRKIASELNISTGSLYHYFSGKFDLFRQMLNGISVSMLNGMDETSTEMSLHDRIEGLFEHVGENELFYRRIIAVIFDFYRRAGGGSDDLKELNQKYRSSISGILGIGDDGIATMIFEYLNGVITQRMVLQGITFKEQTTIFRSMLKTLMKDRS